MFSLELRPDDVTRRTSPLDDITCSRSSLDDVIRRSSFDDVIRSSSSDEEGVTNRECFFLLPDAVTRMIPLDDVTRTSLPDDVT